MDLVQTAFRPARAVFFLALLLLNCTASRPPVAATHKSLPAEPNEHLAWGPACDGRLLDRTYYAVCHSAQWRIPRWVAYRLEAVDLPGTAERKDRFRVDPDLAPGERAELADYELSGYHRGHMAPADDFARSAEAVDATFLLSNMAPQLGSLNSGRWRVLESEVQKLAARHGDVWIVTGPLFLDGNGIPAEPKEFLRGRVAVPTHFFKAMLCVHGPDAYEVYAFVMPHKRGLRGPTRRYAVSVDRLEQWSALDFFGPLPDELEAGLEASVAEEWPVKR